MPFSKWVVNDRVEFSVVCGSVLARALLISDIPARCPFLISAQARADAMACQAQAFEQCQTTIEEASRTGPTSLAIWRHSLRDVPSRVGG